MESNDNVERGGVAVELPGAGPNITGDGGSSGAVAVAVIASLRRGASGCGTGDADGVSASGAVRCSNTVTCVEEESAKEEEEEEEGGAPGGGEKVRDGAQQNLVNKMGELCKEAETGLGKDALPGLAQQQHTDGRMQEEGSPSKTPECDKNHSASDQSLPGESQSIDSLESFSNLNSCPSSDLNSEGAEDRALALALQSEEYNNKDGVAKPSGSKERFPGQSVYHIKWIKWKTENTPIITQNENGPCPLLAIMNVLLLAWKIKLPPMMEIITAEQLMEYLGDYILDAKPKEITDAQRLNYEQNMSDAMAILHKLQTGLDVNVKFTGVRVFEYTPECIVFDLLDIALYHGWLVDPQGQLYLLVTDQGFLTEEKVVWESLHNVDGDGNFCDSEFHLRPPSDPETVYQGQQDQIDQDYLMALSLQQEQQSQDLSWEQIPEGISDLELAKKLQEEEDRRASQFYHEQEQAATAQSQKGQQSQAAAAGRQPGGSERKQRKEPREKEKDKCILL
ncbi:ubiquitin carboxyl-terminal hydrolase MINDY-2 isoform X3 [Heptranchias perlo]|uniref:ubiquitin carboxyl-terminal hydrolase MINDY-2 isoform X3 n=1 Tax=Heptranchias perlo TaxID=212740 RepID=UPI00355AB5C4